MYKVDTDAIWSVWACFCLATCLQLSLRQPFPSCFPNHECQQTRRTDAVVYLYCCESAAAEKSRVLVRLLRRLDGDSCPHDSPDHFQMSQRYLSKARLQYLVAAEPVATRHGYQRANHSERTTRMLRNEHVAQSNRTGTATRCCIQAQPPDGNLQYTLQCVDKRRHLP